MTQTVNALCLSPLKDLGCVQYIRDSFSSPISDLAPVLRGNFSGFSSLSNLKLYRPIAPRSCFPGTVDVQGSNACMA